MTNNPETNSPEKTRGAMAADPATDAPAEILMAAPDKRDRSWLKDARAPMVVPATPKLVTHIPTMTPKDDFARIHPEPGFPALLLKNVPHGMAEGAYLVGAIVAQQLPPGVMRHVVLCRAVTAQGTPFLWPVPSEMDPNADNIWHVTHRRAAAAAVAGYIKMLSDKAAAAGGGGGYKIQPAEYLDGGPEPQWFPQDLETALELAFPPGFYIGDEEHLAVRKILGRIV